jgi:hypothetical protein
MAIADILKKLLLGRAFSAEEGRIVLFNTLEVSMIESKSLVFFYKRCLKNWEIKQHTRYLKKVLK